MLSFLLVKSTKIYILLVNPNQSLSPLERRIWGTRSQKTSHKSRLLYEISILHLFRSNCTHQLKLGLALERVRCRMVIRIRWDELVVYFSMSQYDNCDGFPILLGDTNIFLCHKSNTNRTTVGPGCQKTLEERNVTVKWHNHFVP